MLHHQKKISHTPIFVPQLHHPSVLPLSSPQQQDWQYQDYGLSMLVNVSICTYGIKMNNWQNRLPCHTETFTITSVSGTWWVFFLKKIMFYILHSLHIYVVTTLKDAGTAPRWIGSGGLKVSGQVLKPRYVPFAMLICAPIELSALKSSLVSVLLSFLEGPQTGPVPESFRMQEPLTGTAKNWL